VNEFAEGVFPGVGEIATNIDDAEIAIRHIIVEGYIGDATPGYDGNDNRALLPDGDVSDDSTPGTSFAAPVRWIYETLVRPDAFGAPTTKRGPLIDFFLGLQADLQESKAKLDFDKGWIDCAIIDPDWGDLGLANTKALFDAQTRRNVQNAECGHISEGTQGRANCENAIGAAPARVSPRRV
jgi:hypothetical protein